MGILEYRDVSNSFGGNIPSFMYPIDTAQQAITSFALSPSGDLMAYGTVGGYLQVVATTPDSTATFEGVPACFPEEAPLATEPIPFEEWFVVLSLSLCVRVHRTITFTQFSHTGLSSTHA